MLGEDPAARSVDRHSRSIKMISLEPEATQASIASEEERSESSHWPVKVAFYQYLSVRSYIATQNFLNRLFVRRGVLVGGLSLRCWLRSLRCWGFAPYFLKGAFGPFIS